jgi:hypothetical protein
MIASGEPVVKQGLKMFRSRLFNTLVRCALDKFLVVESVLLAHRAVAKVGHHIAESGGADD